MLICKNNNLQRCQDVLTWKKKAHLGKMQQRHWHGALQTRRTVVATADWVAAGSG